MYRIVREVQECVTEYVVIADSDEEAIRKVEKQDDDCCEINVCPEYILTLKFENREFTERDAKDPVVKHAIARIEEVKEIKYEYIVPQDISVLLEMCRNV